MLLIMIREISMLYAIKELEDSNEKCKIKNILLLQTENSANISLFEIAKNANTSQAENSMMRIFSCSCEFYLCN